METASAQCTRVFTAPLLDRASLLYVTSFRLYCFFRRSKDADALSLQRVGGRRRERAAAGRK